ncbi:MAG: hypothetical protein ABSD12_04575, partial [Paraburkholderia sp.]
MDNQGNDGGKSQKSSKPHFCCLYFKQISSWVALFFFKSDGLLEQRLNRMKQPALLRVWRQRPQARCEIPTLQV